MAVTPWACQALATDVAFAPTSEAALTNAARASAKPDCGVR